MIRFRKAGLYARLLLTISVFFCLHGVSAANPVLTLSSKMSGEPLGRYFLIFEDVTGGLTIDEIASGMHDKEFYKEDTDYFNFGFKESPLWFRLNVSNPSAEEMHWMFEAAYFMVDEIELYAFADGRWEKMATTGARYKFNTRLYDYNTVVFPLREPANSAATYYFRVGAPSIMILPFKAWSNKEFPTNIEKRYAFLGVYFGIIFVMMLYNYFISISIRDVTYTYYVVYLFFLAMSQVSYQGIALQYLWPNSPDWNYNSVFIFTYLTIITGIQFSRSFLSTAKFLPRIDFILKLMMATTTVMLFLLFFVDIMKSVMMLNSMFSLLFILLIAGAASWKSGYRPARFYLLAWSLFLIGTMILGLRNLGIAEENFFTSSGYLIGSAFDVILLSFALADRINTLRNEKDSVMTELERYSRRLVEAQESERKRIASELHDSVGQEILLINNMIRNHISQKSDNTANNEFLNQTAEKVMNTLDEIRSISADLRPPQLDQLGLEKTLNALFEKVSDHTNLVIDSEISLEVAEIPKEQEINVFRIIQEALNNVIKHSSATTCLVSILPEGDNLAIYIIDNGDGFAASEETDELGSYGITGMRERARILGGAISVVSVKGEGTRIAVSFPAQYQILDR